MKTLIITLSLLASQPSYAIGTCYLYDNPRERQQCERDYINQQQEYRNQTDQFNNTINQTDHSQAVAQQADQAIQQQDALNQLLKVLNPEKDH